MTARTNDNGDASPADRCLAARSEPCVWLPGAAQAGHNPALDGLRGVAILAVMLYHFGGLVDPKRLGTDALEWTRSLGWAGVDLFFVLSGFLITGILWNTRGTPNYFRNFYARRALRIFPLYYGILALTAVAAFTMPHPSPGTLTLRANQPWIWLYGTNLFMALTGERLKTNWCDLGHFWSLAVEEQFYLLWPLVVAGCSATRLKRVSGALIGGALLSRLAIRAWLGSRPAYLLTCCRIDGLAMGALLFLVLQAWRQEPERVQRLRRIFASCWLPLSILVLWRGSLQPDDPWVQGIGFSLVVLVSAGCILESTALSPKRTRLARLISIQPLVWLGRYSYGIYALHSLIRPLLLSLFLRMIPAFGSYPMAAFCFLAVSITTSAVLGCASYHLFEAHFLQFKKRFAD